MRGCFVAAVANWGMAPSEFWAMSVREFFWLVAAKRPDRTEKWAGQLTDADVKELGQVLKDHGG